MNDQNPIPQQIVDLLVNDLFKKNGINVEDAKAKLTDDQKLMIKDLVNNLSKQVDLFVKNSSSVKNENS